MSLEHAYPERRHMATISDLLGIRHFSTSNGGTVRRDFLEAVAGALGLHVKNIRTKEEVLNTIWTWLHGEPMPRECVSRGGTITNVGLQGIINGIVENGIIERLGFGWSDVDDERRRAVREAAVRDGQDSFRSDVLDVYNDTCAVTGTNVTSVLEAAHILPYRGPKSNVLENAICLRVDIHRLFDRHMITIDNNFSVILSEPLRISPDYASYHGRSLNLPVGNNNRPSREALYEHRKHFNSL